MSGSQIERKNIRNDVPSVASHSKPAEPDRELHAELHAELHSWRPGAEGLYDPSLEKDSAVAVSDVRRQSHKNNRPARWHSSLQ